LADIFISYSSDDRDKVELLVNQLESAGLSVWWDAELRGGSRFSKEIEHELESAKAVLVVWTRSSVESRWVADEADIGLQAEKLVPICLDTVTAPIGFRQIQTIDFSNWEGEESHICLAMLLKAVAHYTNGHGTKATPVKSGAPDASIAVLPFVNMSSDPEQEYFSDGISEEILNLLSKLGELHVSSRTSSFKFKGRDEDVREIGQSLGVAFILEGSVRKAGNRVRITAQLIEMKRGFHLWSETFDRTLDDIFAVQDDIAAAIVEALKDRILGGDNLVAPHATRSANVEAYDHYLKGHYLIQEPSIESLKAGLDELRLAIQLDPKFAMSYADISDALAQMVSYGIYESRALMGEARNAAYTAVALAPDLPQAHAAMAAVHQYITLDWPAADAAFEKAISLAPQSPVPFHRYSDYLMWTLRTERAREMAKRALAIAPDDGSSMHAVGVSALFCGDFAAAAEAFDAWREVHPQVRWAYVKTAVAQALSGQCAASLENAIKAETLMDIPLPLPMVSWIGWTDHICGRIDRYEKAKSEILSATGEDAVDIEASLFYVYAIEGDCAAFVTLAERWVATKSPLIEVMQIPLLDHMGWAITPKLRDNETYRTLIKDLNFPRTKWSLD
jgi:adenylate cyclase